MKQSYKYIHKIKGNVIFGNCFKIIVYREKTQKIIFKIIYENSFMNARYYQISQNISNNYTIFVKYP